MGISPDTLAEELNEVRRQRERQTGVFGSGLMVLCKPNPFDEPDVAEVQSRVVCLGRPYVGCGACSHSKFALIFKNDRKEESLRVVACPRWKNLMDRLDRKAPEEYVMTELGTCEKQPFEFCPSCPSAESVEKYGADKSKDGWYGRWDRFRRMEFEDD